MKTLSIDIETYSEADLSSCGVYRYADDPSFEVLLFGCSVDGGDVQVYDLTNGKTLPDGILAALTDDTVIKSAFNANFERVCLSRYLGYPAGSYLDPRSWRCTMVWAAYMGLPLSLQGVGEVLKLGRQKLTEGKELVRLFSIPRGGKRCRPGDEPVKWERFKAYNKRDVETETDIAKRLERHPVPGFVWEEYRIDQLINDRGVCLDMALVNAAIAMDAASKEELTAELRQRTQLDNPNSVTQMRAWLAAGGTVTDTLGKKATAALMKTAPKDIADVLALRGQLAKSSVKKYQTMKNAVCSDGRARGMFQFYGASRTGRFAGRLIQMQNLPQNHLPDLDAARSLVKSGDYEAVKMLYGDVPDTLSQLIRTAFVPREGYTFFVADYSAIEARVIAWYAGETWRRQVFAEGKDIYCASASQMFRVPVEKHGINGHLRQKGKIAELALGYGGSVGALTAMGALEMGLKEDELKPLVDAWRSSNPNIVRFWWDVDRAIRTTLAGKAPSQTHGLRFLYESGALYIVLPSGRRLTYIRPRISDNGCGGTSITYEGVGGTKTWERLESYGPKFVENIVQATARDILCHAMKTLKNSAIVMHIHDELVIEAPESTKLEDICYAMAFPPPWADGLLLRADGYITKYYRKD